MIKKYLKTIFLLCLIFFSCSKQENNNVPTDNENATVVINPQDIELSIEDNSYLEPGKILIKLPEDVSHDMINVYLNSELIQELPDDSLSFEITLNNFADGAYVMKIEIIAKDKVIGTKSLNIKIDNNGPEVDFGYLLENNFVCGRMVLLPDIADQVSKVSSVKVFWGQEEIEQLSSTNSDYSFELDSSSLPLGEKYLKLEMQDERGNLTKDSVLVNLAKKITQINFPDGFVRPGVDEIHVILSESDGTYVSSVTHSSGVAETLSICSTVELDQSSEFILTFVSDFEDVVYGIYPYHNLTLNSVGSEINLAKRSGPTSTSTLEIELPDYKDGDYIRASGQWSSALNYQGNILSGHFSSNFTDESLESNNFFIMNFNPDIKESYKWAYIENPHTYFKLDDKDFNSNNVVNSDLNIVGSSLEPYLAVYGFENETHFNSLITHMLYWNPRLNKNNGFDYSYADIFYNVFYSIKVSNYSIEGLGHPPATVYVPNNSINYSFQNNKLSFSGLSDFEVGRAQLRNTDDAHIFVEMFFDGTSTEVVMPKLPEYLGSHVVDIVNNGALEITQCVVENYTNISNYDEYITNIFVPSVPFYKVSPSREKVFKSSVSTSLLPMTEFPFHERF
jgi:hypothetical protein